MARERIDYCVHPLQTLQDSSVLRNRSCKSTKPFSLPQYWPHIRSQENYISVATLIQQEAIGEIFPQRPPLSIHWPTWDKFSVFVPPVYENNRIADLNFWNLGHILLSRTFNHPNYMLEKEFKMQFPTKASNKNQGVMQEWWIHGKN